MTCDVAFVYSEKFLDYKFNDDHPFNQKRIDMTFDLIQKMKSIKHEQIVEPRKATDEEILRVHHPKYVEVVKKASSVKNKLSENEMYEYGIGTEDTPAFANMHDAAAWLVGGTLKAVDLVLNGDYLHAVNLGGGLHHGFSRRASGFCVYNDAAIAIQYIREKTDYKVLYVDTDAHHGDGVQSIFYDDTNVCTLSIHETGKYLFPGTGYINERGQNKGYGYSFNVPIEAFTEDESFIDVYESVLREIAEYFKPDIIITQNGADAHAHDPLTHLNSTMKTYEVIPKLAHEIAHTYCNGRWIALGGGGYDIWRVVPRAWAQLWQIAKGDEPFQGPLPEAWVKRWQEESPVELPVSWSDAPNIYEAIPRKQEITEKNKITLDQCLEIIRNK